MIKKQLYAIVLLTCLVLVGCDVSGDDGNPESTSPSLKTLSTTNITTTAATTGGFIVSDGGKNLIEMGIAWDTLPNPTIFTTKIPQVGTAEQFTATITNLVPNTTYYVRAYAINEIGVAYGNQQMFTTIDGAIVYAIGDIGPGGGFVFEIDATGIHGKEIAPLATQFSTQWGCPTGDVAGTMATVGTGSANSDLILEFHTAMGYYADPDQCSGDIIATGDVAAKQCAELIFNELEDWYLPSIGELELVYTNLISENLGDMADLMLSSSTQDPTDATKHMVLQGETGGTIGIAKSTANAYRAVRNF
ncbi:fibronectin type III domain-containing protein [Flavobacterium sp. SM2513]|uniref:fibronectin type III domain-containing protein n=1 Tax=Flavobacterium sp. SM2513 TaxID=3424766 RepID=UPI003D7F407F